MEDPKELEKQLNELAKKAFEAYSWNMTPLFPNILVRVFDYEEQKYINAGLIIKPETAQAPNHKAIVVRVWQPKEVNGNIVSSELDEGDIVTIPFWSGIPTGQDKLNDAGYRIIPENKARDIKTGNVVSLGSTQESAHIFFKQKLFDKRAAAKEILLMGDSWSDLGMNDYGIEKNIDEVLSRFDIVPKVLSVAQNKET